MTDQAGAGVFLLSLDGMLVHRGVTPQHLIRRYPPGWREAKVLPTNSTQFSRPGLEPRTARPGGERATGFEHLKKTWR